MLHKFFLWVDAQEEGLRLTPCVVPSDSDEPLAERVERFAAAEVLRGFPRAVAPATPPVGGLLLVLCVKPPVEDVTKM